MRSAVLTEAGLGIGLGHLSRCLAIAEAMQEKGIEVDFYVCGDGFCREFLPSCHVQLGDWTRNLPASILNDAYDFIFIDSYRADIGVYDELGRLNSWLLIFDDDQRLKYPSGYIIRGSLAVDQSKYSWYEEERLFLGPDFIVLRRPFWDVPPKKIRKTVKEVLVFFGGVDSLGLTKDILSFLIKEFPSFHLTVVVTEGTRNIDEIMAMQDSSRVTIQKNSSALEMKELMENSDFLLCAGGQTLNEAVRIGLPNIAFSVAENQRANVETAASLGCSMGIDALKEASFLYQLEECMERLQDESTRRQMSNKAYHLIDGQGARRIVGRLVSCFENSNFDQSGSRC